MVFFCESNNVLTHMRGNRGALTDLKEVNCENIIYIIQEEMKRTINILTNGNFSKFKSNKTSLVEQNRNL